MRFKDLAAAELPVDLQSEVDRLLDIKMNTPEIEMVPRVDAINKYLDKSIEDISSLIATLDEVSDKSWETLNSIFLSTITE